MRQAAREQLVDQFVDLLLRLDQVAQVDAALAAPRVVDRLADAFAAAIDGDVGRREEGAPVRLRGGRIGRRQRTGRHRRSGRQQPRFEAAALQRLQQRRRERCASGGAIDHAERGPEVRIDADHCRDRIGRRRRFGGADRLIGGAARGQHRQRGQHGQRRQRGHPRQARTGGRNGKRGAAAAWQGGSHGGSPRGPVGSMAVAGLLPPASQRTHGGVSAG